MTKLLRLKSWCFSSITKGPLLKGQPREECLVNINDLLYNDLNNVGGWAYLTAGSKGIILYRESLENVSAFERHCTFDPTEVCSQVDMHVSLLQANDNDCCGSVFSISSRSIIKGPASRPLIEYETQFDGTYVIVTN